MRPGRVMVACLAALLLGAQSNAQTVFELDLGQTSVERSGNAINSFGAPLREVPKFEQRHLGLTFGTQTQNGFQLQLGHRIERTSIPDFIDTFNTSGDSMEANSQSLLQAGQSFGQTYIGGLYARGNVEFTQSNVTQNASYGVFGIEGAYQVNEAFGVGMQAGTINSSALDPETLDNATFVVANAVYEFADLPLRVRGHLGVSNGEQDTDSGGGPDKINLMTAGIMLEWQPNAGGGLGEATTLYAGYDMLRVVENRNLGANETINQDQFSFGIRIALGNKGRGRVNRTPNFGQWLGAVPAVD